MELKVGINDVLLGDCAPDPFSRSGGVTTASCLSQSRFGAELILKPN